jgi:PAS domain S-box-containing protein
VTDFGVVEQLERQLEVASLSGEVEAVMRGIVEHLMQLHGADGASLSTVDEGYAYFKVSLGEDTPLQGRTIALTETLGVECVETGEVQVRRAAQEASLAESLTEGAGVIVLAPISYDGATRGVLGVRSADENAFTDADVLTVTLLARSAAVALRNAELIERLERSEREYRRLHDQAADAILVTDDTGVMLDANEGAAAMLGYSVEELRAMHARDLFSAAQLESYPPRVELIRAGEAYRAERPFLHKDGSEILVEYACRMLDDGRVHTTMRDVTERRADETRLRSSIERLHAIVETQKEISSLELDQDAVTHAIVERAQRLTHADGAVVATFEGDELVWRFAAGVAREHVGQRLQRGSSLSGLATTLNETLYSADTATDARVDRATADRTEMRSVICAPLHRDGNTVGVLTVGSRLPSAFNELAVETTRLMAEFVSGVMRNAEELETRRQLVERLRLQGQVVEHMQNALWVWQLGDDGVLRIDYANVAGEAATGLAPAEIMGRTIDEVLPSCPAELVTSLTQVLASGEPIDIGEVEYGDARIRSGIFHLKAFPLPGERIAVAFENVTERVRAHRALQESEARFRGAFQATSIGISLSTLEGHLVQANDRLAELLGYDHGELLRLNWRLLMDPDEMESLHEPTQQLLRGERDHYIREVRLRRKDGTEAWAQLGVSLVRDYADEPVHYVSYVEDVSQRHSLELQLRQAQKMEAVGRLAGGIAHDFNNLLTAISGYADFLINGLDDERLRRHAEEIRRASQRAASLTGQLLAFSRRQVLQPRVIDLNAVVTDMEMMLRRLIGEDVELVTRLEADLGSVRADPTQVEQVIINLAVNARDAMIQGGSLTIETANVQLDDRDAVELRLTDTGVGMTADERLRLFDPFFTTKEAGTGLGLATVYGIVEQSGGAIEVDSAPGLGTSFRITLPRVYDAVDHPAPLPPGAVPRSGTETILLVEDEAVVRRLVAEILESNGYSVLQAADGPSALELLRRRSKHVDVLLTDVVMPGMSGPEVAQAVTAMQPGTHVLYMSGYTGSAIDQHGLLEEGVAFLQKPFTADELAQAIRALLDEGARLTR